MRCRSSSPRSAPARRSTRPSTPTAGSSSTTSSTTASRTRPSRRAPTASSPSPPVPAGMPVRSPPSPSSRRSARGSTDRPRFSGAIAHGQSILAALAAGADFAYIGSAFLSTHEANVVDEYRQMIVDSVADDVVYSNYFTGVKGNYLRGSIVAAGLDPDALPEADPTKMDFGTDPESGTSAKAWEGHLGLGSGHRRPRTPVLDGRPRRSPRRRVRGGAGAPDPPRPHPVRTDAGGRHPLRQTHGLTRSRCREPRTVRRPAG